MLHSYAYLWKLEKLSVSKEVVPASEVEKLGKIVDKEDEFLSCVVRSMGSHLSHDRAKELGMVEVPDMVTVPRKMI